MQQVHLTTNNSEKSFFLGSVERLHEIPNALKYLVEAELDEMVKNKETLREFKLEIKEI